MLNFIFSLLYKFKYRLYNLCISRKFKLLKGYIISSNILKGEKYISIGKGTIIGKEVILTAWDKYRDQQFNPSIEIGENCYIGEFAHISACSKISIGNNVLTGRRIYISDNSHGNSTKEEISIPPLERPLHIKGPIIIEDNVWIGERVCILSGVRIGKGAIIAANAVVTHDIPSECVAGGIPAKIIKEIK